MGALFLRHTALRTGVAVEWVFSAPHFSWIVNFSLPGMDVQKATPEHGTPDSITSTGYPMFSGVLFSPEVKNMQSHIVLDIHHSWRVGIYLGLYLPLGMPWALGSDLNTPVGVACQFLLGF